MLGNTLHFLRLFSIHIHIDLDQILSCKETFLQIYPLNQQAEYSLKSQEIHFTKVAESCVHETRAMTYFWCGTNLFIF